MKLLRFESKSTTPVKYVVLDNKDIRNLKNVTDLDKFKYDICKIFNLPARSIITACGFTKERYNELAPEALRITHINEPTIAEPTTRESYDPKAACAHMMASKQKWVAVLGVYWRAKGFEIHTRDQQQATLYTPANIKLAKMLEPFDFKDIVDKILVVDKHAKKNDYNWSLMTLYKFMTT